MGRELESIKFFSHELQLVPHTATHAEHLGRRVKVSDFLGEDRGYLDQDTETGEYILTNARTRDFIEGPAVGAAQQPPSAEQTTTAKVVAARHDAGIKAWESLAGYKFQMFGYWAAAWVKYNELLKGTTYHRQQNPFRGLVLAARAERNRLEGND